MGLWAWCLFREWGLVAVGAEFVAPGEDGAGLRERGLAAFAGEDLFAPVGDDGEAGDAAVAALDVGVVVDGRGDEDALVDEVADVLFFASEAAGDFLDGHVLAAGAVLENAVELELVGVRFGFHGRESLS